MPVPPTTWTANSPLDIVRDAGRLVIGATPFAVLKGGARFDPGFELENIGVGLDGVDVPVVGLDRRIYNGCVLSCVISEFGPATHGNQIAKLEPGSTSVDTGTTPNTKTTITPKAGRALYVAADYLTDVYLVAARSIVSAAGVKGYPSIHIAKAIVRKWDMQTVPKDHATINVEIAGRRDMTTGTLADPDYDIVLWETAP